MWCVILLGKDLLTTCVYPYNYIAVINDQFCERGLSVHTSNFPTLMVHNFNQTDETNDFKFGQ